MTGEYIDHEVAASYCRLKRARHNLQIDLRKTNGSKSFPERPVRLNSGEEMRKRDIEMEGTKVKKEVRVYTAEMYMDQLEAHAISPYQFRQKIKTLTRNG